SQRHDGTINVFVGTDRALAPGALANLLTVAAEAKTATLLAATGFTGTTTDAVVAGCDPDGEPAAFSGSATPVGRAARACVRDALLASLDSRYEGDDFPGSVADAAYGVVTDVAAEVSRVE
ncbi:MAG: adenosylcobinamide amidohydrolase, partial [Haloferacaceae archaeon]